MNNITKETSGVNASPSNPRRRMRSWQADDDVDRMLGRVQAKGIKLSFYANTTLRKALLAAGYGRKKDGAK